MHGNTNFEKIVRLNRFQTFQLQSTFNLLQFFLSLPPAVFAVLFKPSFNVLNAGYFTFRLIWLPVLAKFLDRAPLSLDFFSDFFATVYVLH